MAPESRGTNLENGYDQVIALSPAHPADQVIQNVGHGDEGQLKRKGLFRWSSNLIGEQRLLLETRHCLARTTRKVRRLSGPKTSEI